MELVVVLLIAGGFLYLLVKSYGQAGRSAASVDILAFHGAKLLSEALLRRAIAAFPDHRDELVPDAFAVWSREVMNAMANSQPMTEDAFVRISGQWNHLLPRFLQDGLPTNERKRFADAVEGAFLETMSRLSA